MTAYSITISQTVNVFGPATTDNWNAFNWGSMLWGYGTQSLPKNIVHLFDIGAAISAADALGKGITKVIGESQGSTLSFSGNIRDGNGYLYVLPEQVINISSMSTPNWTQVTQTDPGWSSITAATTSWSTV